MKQEHKNDINAQNLRKIPKLRFPEFEGEWETKKLGEIAKFSKGKGISKADIEENGNIECIRYGELYTTYGEVIEKIYSTTNIDLDKLVLSEKNDIIIPASGETQIDIATASCVLKAGVALGGDLNIIKTPCNGIFLSYYLNSKKKTEIANLAQGISVVHLYSSQLSSLEINYPSIQEQNKIADFFKSYDERIELSKKIIYRYETLMRNLREMIFKQQIKFKDKSNNEFPDWEIKRLGEISEIKKGKQLNKTELKIFGTYPCLNGGISPSGYTENFNSDENTITISEGGNSCGFVNFMTTKFWLGGHCYKIILKDKVDLIYFYQLLKFNEEQIMHLRVGSGLPNIQQKSLREFKLLICKSENEQKLIANFLSFIDQKIEIEMKILEQYKYQKAHLLQNMFI